MKKRLFCLTVFFVLCTLPSPAEKIANRENYAEYTLANGLEIFVLEDFSSATVNIELAVRAGISAQDPENAGFFTLYSRLFKYGLHERDYIKVSSECSADASRYRMKVPPSRLEESLSYMRDRAFFPYFSDSAIKKEHSLMKAEVLSYEGTPASFLNGAIDSRVFSDAPWKQDSGLHPSIFAQKNTEEIRTILKGISENWYATQNTSVFISGCMKKEEMLSACKKIFSDVKPALNPHRAEPARAGSGERKFVIADPNFSSNLTQIVAQFTSLGMTEADLAAETFNRDDFSVKKLLLRQRNLAIREGEYINFAAAHKNGLSRLIVQALMEEPVNKKVNLADQAELFVSKLKEGIKNSAEDEFRLSKKTLSENFSSISANAETFMDYLSQFRAVEDFSTISRKDAPLSERLLSRPSAIQEAESKKIREMCSGETPFVFVLLNTKTYRQNRKAFDKAGYRLIDEKNGSWHRQKLYENLAESKNQGLKDERESEDEKKTFPHDERVFIEENRAAIRQIRLENGIPVSVKTTGTTGNVLIMVSLGIGKFSYPENPGFEKIITQAFATNIQKEVSKYRLNGALEGDPVILSETFNDFTAVTVECAKDDAAICLRCLSDAIIFGEIHPAEADNYVYSVQTQKRLYNAGLVNQLSYRAARWLFAGGTIRKVLDTDSDVLEGTSYQDILNAYPSLLDSRLYSIVIVGNLDWEYLHEPLKNTFGLFSAHGTKTGEQNLEAIDFPDGKDVRVKLRHIFTTDVKAEDAGPMPAVLIPTVNFSDPVQFWLEAPLHDGESEKSAMEETVYDALMFRFRDFLEERAEAEYEEKKERAFSEIRLFERTKEIPAAAFTFMTVDHTARVEEFFRESVELFLEYLEDPWEARRVRDSWISNALSGTSTNRGTALLVRRGGKNPCRYLDSYSNILDAEDLYILETAKKYILPRPKLRLYSAESAR